jgi:zinc dependent phospholipase C
LYDATSMWFAALAALAVLCWPGDAYAWGPVTHLIHGSQVLDSLSIVGAGLQEILREHRLAYLYGCVAADIVQAKRYTRSMYTHCHCWPVGWQIARAATTEREQAFAYGYLSHLAGDVFSHNQFVPVQMIVSFEARGTRHIYWEARFDAAQRRDRQRMFREVFEHRYPDCDRLVEKVVEQTLFSFRTNKRIFNSVMAVQRLGQWQGLVRGLAARSRYPLPEAEVERFNGLCVGAIHDLLARGKRSACQKSDPTGHDALKRADGLRRKLRALRRRGQLTEEIVAELRGLSAA